MDKATKRLVESGWVEELDEGLSSTTVGSGETMAVRSTVRERDKKKDRIERIERETREREGKGKGKRA